MAASGFSSISSVRSVTNGMIAAVRRSVIERITPSRMTPLRWRPNASPKERAPAALAWRYRCPRERAPAPRSRAAFRAGGGRRRCPPRRASYGGGDLVEGNGFPACLCVYRNIGAISWGMKAQETKITIFSRPQNRPHYQTSKDADRACFSTFGSHRVDHRVSIALSSRSLKTASPTRAHARESAQCPDLGPA